MKYQDFIIASTKEASSNLFKAAKKTAADKVSWKPMDAGRSVLSICQECAKCADWAVEILTNRKAGEHNEESMKAYMDEVSHWDTVEKCEAAAAEKLEKYYTYLATIPESAYRETCWLPFDGGRDFSVAELFNYPLWNMNYHEGQVGYIQTLYGDMS